MFSLFIVIPCYNEETVLVETNRRLITKIEELIQSSQISTQSRILYVDDGSTDSSWQIIKELYNESTIINAIKLSRNRGHQNALFAGLLTAAQNADYIISMDADLQHDICAIDEFIEKYMDGCDIVFGVRKNRKTDNLFKRTTASLYYKLLKAFDVNAIPNSADYRGMSKRAVEALAKYQETNPFLRGLLHELGFKTAVVEYDCMPRYAGSSKYSLKKMFSLAFDGLTSFSLVPLRSLFMLSAIICVVSLIILTLSVAKQSLLICILGSVWLIGGLLCVGLGIIGEYVGRTFIEVKKRPRYIIEETLPISPPPPRIN